MIQLPGLIDPHVHLRTPGQTQKEDFTTGTSAALAGGYTTIIDMPNNLQPITTLERLNAKITIAKQQIVCDVGFYFGSLGENSDQFEKVQNKVLGLKVYLNQTTGDYIVNENVFEKICNAWPVGKPIVVHAEANVISLVIEIAHRANQRLHIAHISSKTELQAIIDAKMKGYKVTCGVTLHHLFLTEEHMTKLGNFGLVKPSLKTKQDQEFLWQHLKDIDIIESDHAPHTIQEKQSQNPTSGVPGLETTLPLLLTAVHQDRLSIEEISRLCYENPKKIFQVPTDINTYIEIDENEEWTIQNDQLFTKCKWTPFNGWKVKGKVKTVYLRGEKVFGNGDILAKPGSGKIIV